MEIDEIKCGEGERLEFKRALTKDDIKWLKTVVALANGRGGRIIFGVDSDLSLEKMMQGYSNCRNKALAEAFVYMNIIENWGSGIRRVKAEVKKAGLAAPEYTVWPNAIRVCLRRAVHAGETVNETVKETINGVDVDRDLDRDLDDLEKKVIKLITADCNVTYAKLSEQCGCSVPTVQRRICSLQKKGLIHRVGPDKGGHWEVCQTDGH